MKKSFLIATAVLFVAIFVLPVDSLKAQPYGFEGTQVCGVCHKSEKSGQQLKIWQESAHAKAYKALQTPEADKIAMEKFGKKAVEAEGCLKCHVSGHGVDAKLIGAKFKMEDGVQCETCHGAGSAYKSLKVMKNHDDAVKNGLVVHAEKEKFCTTCHNSESPTFKGFKYEEMWAKIAHPTPKG